MWFRIPDQIYFNLNAVENVGHFPSRSTIIITNPAMEQIGHVDVVNTVPESVVIEAVADIIRLSKAR